MSRSDNAAAADGKKTLGRVMASKSPASLAKPAAPTRPTQGGKTPYSMARGRLLAAQKDKPIDRLKAKSGAKEKEPRVHKRRINRIDKELRDQQKTVVFAIPRAAFQRWTREVTREVDDSKAYRFTRGALEAIQTFAEDEAIKLFGGATRLVHLLRHKMVLGRTFRFAVEGKRLDGVPWYMAGPLESEVFEMGGGKKMIHIQGARQIKEYMAAARAIAAEEKNAKPKKKKKAKKAAAAAAPDEAVAADDDQDGAVAPDEAPPGGFPEPADADVDE